MKNMNKTKKILLLALITVIFTCSIGGTIAFLIDDTDPVTNTFKPTTMSNTVEEDFQNDEKKDVTIKNTSTDVDAYVRAAIVVTWQDAAKNVYPQMPVAGEDYSISLNTTDWTTERNGFYYHKAVVKADESSAVLISNCTPVAENTPAGYGLVVEILSSAIQAEPETAVETAWGVTVTDGEIQ